EDGDDTLAQNVEEAHDEDKEEVVQKQKVCMKLQPSSLCVALTKLICAEMVG
ncbi:hypothetical protein F442_13132, partial [Phytophthora nicotianae P10297]